VRDRHSSLEQVEQADEALRKAMQDHNIKRIRLLDVVDPTAESCDDAVGTPGRLSQASSTLTESD
jgi:hypothetical protein